MKGSYVSFAEGEETRDTLCLLAEERRRLLKEIDVSIPASEEHSEARERLKEIDALWRDLWKKCPHRNVGGKHDLELVTRMCKTCGRIFSPAAAKKLFGVST